MGQKKLESTGKCFFVFFFPDKICTAEHIAPLVITAHLQAASITMKQLQEIIALHKHVCEFQETETVFSCHPGFIAFCGQHAVDRELRTDIPHKIDKVQVTEPVAVIDDQRFAIIKIEETGHLLFDAFNIPVNGFHGQHFSHIGFSGRVTNHGCSAAHKRDGLVTRPLHMSHGHDRNIVPDMQAVGGRVKSYIKSGRRFKLLIQFVLKSHLCNKSAFFQNVKNMFHFFSVSPYC